MAALERGDAGLQAPQGFRQFLKTLDDGRIAISALALGLITRMREEATAYAKTRTAFGRPIGVNQGVAFPIADLAVTAAVDAFPEWAAMGVEGRGAFYEEAGAHAFTIWTDRPAPEAVMVAALQRARESTTR